MKKESEWHHLSRKQWDESATSWDEHSVARWDKGSRKDIIPFIEKHVPKGSYIADIGCGSGYSTYKLLQAGYEVIGTDISEEMIRIAKEKVGTKIPFIRADICQLNPIKDEQLDALMVINVIEWTEIPVTALNELKRTLKPGGLLCIGILGPTAGPRNHNYLRIYGEKVIMNSMLPWEFSKMALETGWSLVDGFGVYKQEVMEKEIAKYSTLLKQSLSFMWVFMLKKE